MKRKSTEAESSPDSLLVEIVDILDGHGVDSDTYTIYEYIDPDALEQVVATAHESLEIRLTIEGIRLSITQRGVRSLDTPSNLRDSSS